MRADEFVLKGWGLRNRRWAVRGVLQVVDIRQRRILWRVLAVFLCTMAVQLNADEKRPKARRSELRRNVLFIAVDDLRPELGCYGHSMVKSPNIDRLARQGLLFDCAYCQQAVCGATRFSLLTGLRPDTTGVFGNSQPLRKTIPDVLSLPQYFRQHGYETVSLGKIYHHTKDDNQIGWTGEAWHPSGDWKGRGYLNPDSIKRIQPKEKAQGNPGVGPAYESADVPDEAYPDGKTAEKAKSELRRLKKGGDSFFLAVGFVKPHLPFNSPQRYWDLYDPAKISLPEQSTWPDSMPSIAGTSWGELRKYAGMPRRGAMPVDEARNLIHGYYAATSYTDSLIGEVVDELETLGLRDNTVIILWGDHGWKLGNYGAWCKHTNFEIDTHVPLLLSVPGQATAGQRTSALVEYVDIFPTLAELCGMKVPPTCDGTSMVPLVENPLCPWKKAAFSQYPRGKVMGYSMRYGRWRYVEWIERRSHNVVARELYDHSDSPIASRNLSEEPDLSDTVRELSAILDGGQGWRAVREQLSLHAD